MYSLLLLLAIAFEIAGTTALKASAGFSKPTPTVVMVVCYLLCFALLGLSLKGLDVSVAYAVWSGLGTAAIAIIGFAVFHEEISVLKVACIGLIVVGVVGLNLNASGHAPPPAAAPTAAPVPTPAAAAPAVPAAAAASAASAAAAEPAAGHAPPTAPSATQLSGD